MANYQYSSDILDDILFRAGEAIDGSSDFQAAALRYLNRAYQAIWSGGGELVPNMNEKWDWLRKNPPGVITMEPKYTTGTLSVTNNSTTITFSTNLTKSLVGWYIKIDDHADMFRLTSASSGQAGGTLESVYTGTTASGKSFTAYKLDYDIASDVLQLIAPMRTYQDRSKVDGMDERALRTMWPLRMVTGGVPKAFALIDGNTVRFSHYGRDGANDLIKLEYEYLQRPSGLTDSGAEEPLVPFEHRKVLADYATYMLFLDKNDRRADAAGLLAKNGLIAMQKQNNNTRASLGDNVGMIRPRGRSGLSEDGIVRTSTGLIIG